MGGGGEGGPFEGVLVGGAGGVALHLVSDDVAGFELKLKTILCPCTAVVTCFARTVGSDVLGSEGKGQRWCEMLL